MNTHPQFDEDFDLYALGALDVDERQKIESHIRDCRECAQRLAEAQRRIAMLALTVPAQAPPARVKQQLLARVKDQKSGSAEKATRESTSWLNALWRRPQTAWTLAAVSAAIAVAFANVSYHLEQAVRKYHSEEQSQRAAVARADAILALLNAKDTQGVTLTALPEKPQPTGRVLYHPEHGLIFYAQNLPAPPANRVYQLWLVPPQGDPISAGTFSPDTKGTASIVLPPLPKGVSAKAFAVTIEPEGGVPKATGPKVLIGYS